MGILRVVDAAERLSVKDTSRGGRERIFSLCVEYHLECASCHAEPGRPCRTGKCVPYFRPAKMITVVERDPETQKEADKTYVIMPNEAYDAIHVKLEVEYKKYARNSQSKRQRKFFSLALEGTEYIYTANRYSAEGQFHIGADAIGVEDDSPTFEADDGGGDEPGRMVAVLQRAVIGESCEATARGTTVRAAEEAREAEEDEDDEDDDDEANVHQMAVSEVKRKRGGLWITPKEQRNLNRSSSSSTPRPRVDRRGKTYYPAERLHTLEATMLRANDFIKRIDSSHGLHLRLTGMDMLLRHGIALPPALREEWRTLKEAQQKFRLDCEKTKDNPIDVDDVGTDAAVVVEMECDLRSSRKRLRDDDDVRFVVQTGTHKLIYIASPHMPLRKCMRHFRRCVGEGPWRFRSAEGDAFVLDQTLDECGIEDGDILDAYVGDCAEDEELEEEDVEEEEEEDDEDLEEEDEEVEQDLEDREEDLDPPVPAWRAHLEAIKEELAIGPEVAAMVALHRALHEYGLAPKGASESLPAAVMRCVAESGIRAI